jgi:hypothetical protein
VVEFHWRDIDTSGHNARAMLNHLLRRDWDDHSGDSGEPPSADEAHGPDDAGPPISDDAGLLDSRPIVTDPVTGDEQS